MKRFLAVMLVMAMLVSSVVTGVQAAELKHGMMSFSFDDWDATQYKSAYPILKKLKIQATVYVIPDYVGWGTYYGTWSQLQTVSWKSGWEVGNHGISHPHLGSKSDPEIRANISGAEALFAQYYLDTFGAFAPPYGEPYEGYSDGVYDARVMESLASTGLLMSSRRAWTEDSPLNGVATFDRWSIIVVSLRSDTTEAELKNLIDRAIAEKKWLVLTGHITSTVAGDEYTISPTLLKNVASYANSRRSAGELDIVTVSAGVKAMEIAKNLP